MDDDFVADVMSTLRLIPRWRLTGPEWEGLQAALSRLADAMPHGDTAAVASALDEIERFGPSRLGSISRPGSLDQEGSDRRAPPEPVLEILNTLVHPSGGWNQPG